MFPYNLGLFSKYTKNEAKDLINSIISQYNADSYTDIVEYKPSLTATRVYVYLDYSKLNNLSGVDDELNGLQNTITLNSLVGSATTNAFEEALKNTMKEEEGKENENMFRLPNSDEINDLKIPSESGEVDMQSGILNFVLKKNRYYLRRVTNNETGAVTTAPYLKEEDIVWYLPACGQFPSNTNINAANYWSSTAVDDGVNAYLGSGTDKRTNRHKVIAVRNN